MMDQSTCKHINHEMKFLGRQFTCEFLGVTQKWVEVGKEGGMGFICVSNENIKVLKLPVLESFLRA